MARIEQQIQPHEAATAVLISKLAEALQDLAYYAEFQNIPLPTRRAVLKCYRVAKSVTEFYFGAEHVLVFDAPDYRFKKGTK